MTTAPLGIAPAAPVQAAASFRRRATALALDSLLLLAALWWALLAEVAFLDEAAVGLFVGAWLLACPLYFALYHGHGTGRTPGEREVGIALVDAASGRRLGIGRASLHAVSGIASVLLVLPLVLDVVLTVGRRDERAWHDRIFGAAVVDVAPVARERAAWPPTVAEHAQAFDLRAHAGYLTAARALPWAIRAPLKEATWRAYAGLVGLSVLLLPLLVADAGTELDSVELVTAWVSLSGIVLVSGVYWSQAAVVVTLEAARTGEGRLRLGELLRRAMVRANAMTLAVLVLAALVAPVLLLPYLLPVAAFLVARFGLVVPVLLLEDTTVHGAFLRSWQLTRRRTSQAVGLLVGTVLPATAVLGVSLAIFAFVSLLVTFTASPLEFALAAGVVLFVFTLPTSRLLASFGAAWCLFYYDSRGDAAAPAGR